MQGNVTDYYNYKSIYVCSYLLIQFMRANIKIILISYQDHGFQNRDIFLEIS